METKLARNSLFALILSIVGFVFIAFCLYFTVLVITNSAWSDTPFRIVQILLLIGGIILITLARVVRNQGEIIRLLHDGRKDSDNA
ncbi:MAG: hypothetical protein FWE34_01280 [Defluviitaleaceae bacterium]|nr:hypothetical protein [Defluviitaleaceae bacterium]